MLEAARTELAEHGHAAISLRAVARRAGLSHAAPKAHFEDRAALLTAVAVDGFRALAADLTAVHAGPGTELAGLGRAYVQFGLANPALFDLMFRPSELHPDDPVLQQAQSEAIGVLRAAVGRLHTTTGSEDGADVQEGESASALALVSWAFVQGLVLLTRDGALAGTAGLPSGQTAEELALQLVDVFAAAVNSRATT